MNTDWKKKKDFLEGDFETLPPNAVHGEYENIPFRPLDGVFMEEFSHNLPAFAERPCGASHDVVVDFQACAAYVCIRDMKQAVRSLEQGRMEQGRIEQACKMICRHIILPRTAQLFGEVMLFEVSAVWESGVCACIHLCVSQSVTVSGTCLW